ncbi:uncharacterized protein LOC143177324 [Calliopsis andreniformis]|uniref:uncharacterized protein LOC143177324 n=1 Tax=Calliopsis andreniformis TaxID=337506 RepID=UPI003FCD8CB6
MQILTIELFHCKQFVKITTVIELISERMFQIVALNCNVTHRYRFLNNDVKNFGVQICMLYLVSLIASLDNFMSRSKKIIYVKYSLRITYAYVIHVVTFTEQNLHICFLIETFIFCILCETNYLLHCILRQTWFDTATRSNLKTKRNGMTVSLLKSFLSSTVKCINRASSSHRIGIRKANFHVTRTNLQSKCTDGPAYTTRLVLPPDYENVVEFMCEAYYKHEPAVVNVGLGGTEPPLCIQQMMQEQLKEGYSIIAVDNDHCIIGAAINAVALPSESARLYQFAKCCEPPRVRQVIEFYAYVVEKSNLWERYCVDRIFQQSCVAVSCDHQGMGVARRLIEESWILARDCGFQLFCIECNSVYCARICEGFRWQSVWSIPFSQYVRNCELVFHNIKEPHTMCRVFVDDLTYSKTFTLPYRNTKKTDI